eukprot:CAMPEP_0180677916 /NCGR_PEP_ID=MMETSP1037_2-20121125/68103_1 /TAXON_ID=632150 /ORGANISM="Azadinium spinosum, Strain 3D9" /LENGTH=505 /DNA_ID=CAMNT_0022707523 /DNA_START=41 /DNA_END=1555 /DNA_ORIENTATION=+
MIRGVFKFVFRILRCVWRQWLIVTAIWFVCAIWVTAALKAAKHKGLFSLVGNGVLSSLLVAPFALFTIERKRSRDETERNRDASDTEAREAQQSVTSLQEETSIGGGRQQLFIHQDDGTVFPESERHQSFENSSSHPNSSMMRMSTTTSSNRSASSTTRSSTTSYRLKLTSLSSLNENFRMVLLVATFTGLNRTLSNCSLYFIDAWLKTALLALAVPFTFVFGAFVPGVDERARAFSVDFLLRGSSSFSAGATRSSRYSTIAMIPALLLISIGGIVTALPSSSSTASVSTWIFYSPFVSSSGVPRKDGGENMEVPDVEGPGEVLFRKSALRRSGEDASRVEDSIERPELVQRGEEDELEDSTQRLFQLEEQESEETSRNTWSYLFGVSLQMLSNCAGAGQNVCTKVLLSKSKTRSHAGGDQEHLEELPPVSKPQIALLTQPLIALFGFLSVIIFEHSDFTPPPFFSLVAFAFGVTGILVCELRLVELTSALTLAVLCAAHNVIMV